MTQLSYQPAFDPYNAMFRVLQLRLAGGLEKPVPYEAVRIADFFLSFPFFLGESLIRFKREHTWIRKVGRDYEDARPYAHLPDRDSLFRRMEPFQIAAINSLVKNRLLSEEKWKIRMVSESSGEIPKELFLRIEAENSRNMNLVKAVVALLSEYDVSGRDGLKDRTRLLEFRYDAI